VGRVRFAILVISDSRTTRTDESGRVAADLLQEGGHRVVQRAFLKNDPEAIVAALRALTQDPSVDAILTIGGTGISRRDLTIEAVLPLMNKRLDGFGELFRALSYKQVGTRALLSRSMAGVVDGKVVVCVPGSVRATELAVKDIIIPEVGHMVFEASR